MSEIVILTVARDDHACLIDAALRALGADSALICQTPLPGEGDVTVREDGADLWIAAGGAGFRLSDVRSFWNRRRATAFEMPAWTHPADVKHIEENFTEALDGVAVLLDDRFTVNPSRAARVTANKLNQLRQAGACGLSTPATLVSNDPNEVQRFAAATGRICVKPFMVFAWVADGAEARSLTTIVDNPADLDPTSVALMPALYQAYIDKAFEVRVTLFGAVVVATRINLSSDPHAQTDWRVNTEYLRRLEPITPPDEVIKRSRDLLRRLDLRFGAIDFIVTPEGQWVFLEVNESGQFLWQEQFCPGQSLIEPFARFLIAADPTFDWRQRRSSDALTFPRVADLMKADPRYDRIRKRAAPAHDRHSAKEVVRDLSAT